MSQSVLNPLIPRASARHVRQIHMPSYDCAMLSRRGCTAQLHALGKMGSIAMQRSYNRTISRFKEY